MNFFQKTQKMASAEAIVRREFGCEGGSSHMIAFMQSTFRAMLDAGGNEYDAAIFVVLGAMSAAIDDDDSKLTDLNPGRISETVASIRRLRSKSLLHNNSNSKLDQLLAVFLQRASTITPGSRCRQKTTV
jgi:hypothetical protein